MTFDLGINFDDLTGADIPPAEAEFVRPATEADLAALGNSTIEASKVTRITERHHALAKALVSGMKEGEAAALTGYQPAHVSVLKQSPAFIELMALYRNEVNSEFAELTGMFAGLTKDAILELRRRVEEDPEKFSAGQLLDLITKIGDRAGFAPVQRSEATVNISLSAKLEAARKRMAQVVEAEVLPLREIPNDL